MTIDLGYELDLHHFSPRDTSSLINEFISQSCDRGYGTVRIIHGRGKSVKKSQVYSILEKDTRVVSYADDGSNWGATMVQLNVSGGGKPVSEKDVNGEK